MGSPGRGHAESLPRLLHASKYESRGAAATDFVAHNRSFGPRYPARIRRVLDSHWNTIRIQTTVRNRFDSNRKFSWIRTRMIDAPGIHFQVYDGFCQEDRAVENGLSGCSQLAKLCDINIPGPVQSLTNQMTLNLVIRPTGVSDAFPRFKIRWSSVAALNGSGDIVQTGPAVCGTAELWASMEEQTLTSPGFPYGYASNLDCVWTIRHPRNYSISINVTQMSLEPHPHCAYDYLELYQSEPCQTVLLVLEYGPNLFSFSPNFSGRCVLRTAIHALASSSLLWTLRPSSDEVRERSTFESPLSYGYQFELFGFLTYL